MCGPYTYLCYGCFREILTILRCGEECRRFVDLQMYLNCNPGEGKQCHECEDNGPRFLNRLNLNKPIVRAKNTDLMGSDEVDYVYDGYDYEYQLEVRAAMELRRATIAAIKITSWEMDDLAERFEQKVQVSRNHATMAVCTPDWKLSNLDTYSSEFTGYTSWDWDLAVETADINSKIRQNSLDKWNDFESYLRLWAELADAENWAFDAFMQELGNFAMNGIAPDGTDAHYNKRQREMNTWGCSGEFPIRDLKVGMKRKRADFLRNDTQWEVKLQNFVTDELENGKELEQIDERFDAEADQEAQEAANLISLFGGLTMDVQETRAAKRAPTAMKAAMQGRSIMPLPAGRGYQPSV